MQDLDKFIIKTEDYNPDIYKSANMIINHYWLTGFTVSLVNIIAYVNNIHISADSESITLGNQTYISEVKYLKKDRTLTVKESTFGDVSKRPNVYVIPMIIPEKRDESLAKIIRNNDQYKIHLSPSYVNDA